MPKYSSTCITIDYLTKVRAQRFWVPRCEELKNLPCPNPPTLIEIMSELYAAAEENNLILGMDQTHLPDKTWALLSLSTLLPHHIYFTKGYNYEKAKPKNQKPDRFVDNNDGIYEGLVLTSHTKFSKKKQMRSFKHFEAFERPVGHIGKSQAEILKQKFRGNVNEQQPQQAFEEDLNQHQVEEE